MNVAFTKETQIEQNPASVLGDVQFVVQMLTAIHDSIDSSCHECDSKVAKRMAAELLDKLEGGGK